jgi:hypothetical protein
MTPLSRCCLFVTTLEACAKPPKTVKKRLGITDAHPIHTRHPEVAPDGMPPLTLARLICSRHAIRNFLYFQTNKKGSVSMEMPIEVWLPGMFVLGLVSMALCLFFMKACEKI